MRVFVRTDQTQQKTQIDMETNESNGNEKPGEVKHAISYWVAFDWNKIETRPTEYGKYLICRKDGKIHWETWNGTGWAYNHNEIRFWAVIVSPFS